MNERGMSYLESMLAIAVLFLIATVLIPAQQRMNQTLQKEIQDVHISEVALNGALNKKYYGENEGVITIDDVTYEWHYKEHSICVQYKEKQQRMERCIKQ